MYREENPTVVNNADIQRLKYALALSTHSLTSPLSLAQIQLSVQENKTIL